MWLLLAGTPICLSGAMKTIQLFNLVNFILNSVADELIQLFHTTKSILSHCIIMYYMLTSVNKTNSTKLMHCSL